LLRRSFFQDIEQGAEKNWLGPRRLKSPGNHLGDGHLRELDRVGGHGGAEESFGRLDI
jgi:hypothetical protein